MGPPCCAHRTCGPGTPASARAAKGPAPGGSTEAAAGGAEGEAGGGEHDPHICPRHTQGEAPGLWWGEIWLLDYEGWCCSRLYSERDMLPRH